MVTTNTPEAVILAYQQLVMLNMTSWQPKIADWLRSEDAQPQLKELLENVPCSGTVH